MKDDANRLDRIKFLSDKIEEYTAERESLNKEIEDYNTNIYNKVNW